MYNVLSFFYYYKITAVVYEGFSLYFNFTSNVIHPTLPCNELRSVSLSINEYVMLRLPKILNMDSYIIVAYTVHVKL